jgi:Cdc6-like AAA superfamily ATPase
MQTIEGKYGIEPAEDTRPEPRERSRGNETLLAPIIRLLMRRPPAFTDDFFAGVSTVLVSMHAQLRSVLVSTEKNLSEEADRWAKTAAAAYGQDGDVQQQQQQQQDNDSGNEEGTRQQQQQQQQQPERRGPGRPRKYPVLQPRATTNLEKWNISRAKDDKIETMQDRRIIYLIERVTSLKETLQSVNRLLGPKVFIDVPVTRGGGLMRVDAARQTFATFVKEQPLFADGLDRWWDPVDNTGIYLLYDYDYDARRVKAVPGGLAIDDAQNREIESATLTKIREARREWLAGLQNSLMQLNNLTGLVLVKDQIGGIIQTLLVSPVDARAQFLNMAITGDPGTGKTEVARILPSIFYRLGYAPRPYPVFDQIPITTKPDWIAPYEGQSAAQAKLTMLRSVGRVGVIDEAYSLVTDDGDGFGKEALSQIVSDLDELRGLVIIVVLGYEEETKEMFRYNPGLGRRFPYRVNIEPYSSAELYTILMNRMEATGIAVPGALRRSQDMMDLFEDMARRGVFQDVNAAAMSTIVGLYRTAFAIERFEGMDVAVGGRAPRSESGQKPRMRVEEIVAEERILLIAVRNYARAAGFRVFEKPVTPLLSESPPSSPPRPSGQAEPVTPIRPLPPPPPSNSSSLPPQQQQGKGVQVEGVREAPTAARRRLAAAGRGSSGGVVSSGLGRGRARVRFAASSNGSGTGSSTPDAK